MATILGSRVSKEGKIIYEVEMDYQESLQLKGHLKNVYLFSENVTDTRTNISGRGKNEVTKYFLIPRELRSNIKLTDKVKCQKIETPLKIIFIYVVDKIRL